MSSLLHDFGQGLKKSNLSRPAKLTLHPSLDLPMTVRKVHAMVRSLPTRKEALALRAMQEQARKTFKELERLGEAAKWGECVEHFLVSGRPKGKKTSIFGAAPRFGTSPPNHEYRVRMCVIIYPLASLHHLSQGSKVAFFFSALGGGRQLVASSPGGKMRRP